MAAEEQNMLEELAEIEYESDIEQDPPDQTTTTSQDNEPQAESSTTEQSGPIHERCVHGEINEICVPLDIILDRSEVYFRVQEPYEIQPLSKYIFREWTEAEHLFKPAIDFAEEIYGDWSPCPSPTSTSIGL